MNAGTYNLHKMAGVQKEVLRAGSGPTPQKGATITVHCTGSLNTNPPKKFWRYVFSDHYDSHYKLWKLVTINVFDFTELPAMSIA